MSGLCWRLGDSLGELAFCGGADCGGDRGSLQSCFQLCCGVLGGGTCGGTAVCEQCCPDLASGSDGPGADDLAVPPQGGADVAAVVEYVVLGDAEEPVALFPA